MKQSQTLFTLGFFFLAGCVGKPVELPPLNTAELGQFNGPKKSSLSGQAFLRQQGGTVVTCAGSPVYLLPHTTYTFVMIQQLKQGRSVGDTKADPRLAVYSHQSQCDATGSFAFDSVSAGPYFVTTNVSWTVGYMPQGGSLVKEIMIPPGQAVKTILTDADFVGF